MELSAKDRIKLAEARGWTYVKWRKAASTRKNGIKWLLGKPPGKPDRGQWGLNQVPDPFTDANDCEALVRHVNKQGWDVDIWWSGVAHLHRTNVACRVRARFRDGSKERYDIACDDWKQGVCELALKVIDNA